MPISGDALSGDFFLFGADLVSFCQTVATASVSPANCTTPPQGSQTVIIRLPNHRTRLLKLKARYQENLAVIEGLTPVPSPAEGRQEITFGTSRTAALLDLKSRYQEDLAIIEGLTPVPSPAEGSQPIKLPNITDRNKERLNKLKDKLTLALSAIKRC